MGAETGCLTQGLKQGKRGSAPVLPFFPISGSDYRDGAVTTKD